MRLAKKIYLDVVSQKYSNLFYNFINISNLLGLQFTIQLIIKYNDSRKNILLKLK